MWKNAYNQFFSSPFLMDRGKQERQTLSSSVFLSGKIKSFPQTCTKGDEISSKNTPPSEDQLHEYKAQAEEGLLKIQDPLWYRICVDIFQTLGPIAFKDLWKTKLVGISSEGKRAFLSCPNEHIAMALDQYHFVIIGALKKFYPSVSVVETEISDPERKYKLPYKASMFQSMS